MSNAHQQGRTAARQLLAEYAEPTCSSSRTLPALPMAEMLIRGIQQRPAEAGQFIVGWCEIVAPILTSAIDATEPT